MTGLGINTSVNGSRAQREPAHGGRRVQHGLRQQQQPDQQRRHRLHRGGQHQDRELLRGVRPQLRGRHQRRHAQREQRVPRQRSSSTTATTSLDANDYFSERAQRRKCRRSRYNNFGWSLGGPIQQEQAVLLRRPGVEADPTLCDARPARTLPTRAMRSGDFSALTTVDPRSAHRPAVPRQHHPGQPHHGRTDARSPTSTRRWKRSRQLVRRHGPSANNALFQGDNPFDFRQDIVRLDYQASQTSPPDAARHLRQLRPGRSVRHVHRLAAADHPDQPAAARAATTRSATPGRCRRTSSTSSRPTPPGTASASRPIGDVWKRETYGFAFPQLFADGGRFENSIPDTTITGYASFNGVARSLISPTTDIQFSDNLTLAQGRTHAEVRRRWSIRNRKDQNGRSLYAAQLAFNPAGQLPVAPGNAFADALLGNFRTYTEAAYDPHGLLPLLADRRLRLRQLARVAQPERRGRRALHVAPADLHPGRTTWRTSTPRSTIPARAVTVNRNGTLVPGSGDPLQRDDSRRATASRRSELGRVPNGNRPAGALGARRRAARLLRSPPPVRVRASASRGRRRATARPRFAAASASSTIARRATSSSAAAATVRSTARRTSSARSTKTATWPSPGGGARPCAGAARRLSPRSIRTWRFPAPGTGASACSASCPGASSARSGTSAATGQNLLRQPDINQPSFEELEANAALPAAQRANTNFLRPYKGYSDHPDALVGRRLELSRAAAVPEPPARHAALARSATRSVGRTTTPAATATIRRTIRTRTSTGVRATSTARTSWSAPGRGRCRSSGTDTNLVGISAWGVGDERHRALPVGQSPDRHRQHVDRGTTRRSRRRSIR